VPITIVPPAVANERRLQLAHFARAHRHGRFRGERGDGRPYSLRQRGNVRAFREFRRVHPQRVAVQHRHEDSLRLEKRGDRPFDLVGPRLLPRRLAQRRHIKGLCRVFLDLVQ
jgi:hypothetical protein